MSKILPASYLQPAKKFNLHHVEHVNLARHQNYVSIRERKILMWQILVFIAFSYPRAVKDLFGLSSSFFHSKVVEDLCFTHCNILQFDENASPLCFFSHFGICRLLSPAPNFVESNFAHHQKFWNPRSRSNYDPSQSLRQAAIELCAARRSRMCRNKMLKLLEAS